MQYNNPISYSDIEDKDSEISTKLLDLYKDEIKHFKITSELYISLFSNSRRTHRDTSKSDNIQLIAIRIFQDTRAALLLALRGLYPQSSSLLRGTLESIDLIYDFIINPQNEDLWFDGSKSKRKKLFKAGAVRIRVEESKIRDSSPSKSLYSLMSNYSVHPNMESHLWYIEITDKVYYHWAGTESTDKSDSSIISVLNSLAQALFVLTYEDIYAHDRFWLKSFTKWKKDHLLFMKKFGKYFGDTSEWKIIPDKVKYIG